MVADIRQFLTGPTMPVMINTTGHNSLGVHLAAMAVAAPASGTPWAGLANTALFVPFVVTEPFLAQKIGVYNGATAAGNLDVGIINQSGTRVVAAGSTAQSGTNTIQEFNITDTTLQPGRYYLGVSASDATATVFCASLSSLHLRLLGCGQMAAAIPIPSSVTLAAYGPSLVPIMTIAGRTLLA